MKKRSKEILAIAILAVACLIGAGTGCVQTVKLKVHPTAMASASDSDKLPVSAALVMDQELKAYSVVIEFINGRTYLLIGDQLAFQAEDVVRNIFSQVTVYDSLEAAKGQADVIVIPRPARSSYHATDPINLLIAEEWTVKDRTGQKILWLTTVESEAKEISGVFNHRKHERLAWERVFNGLGEKALKAFRDSPEVQRLGHAPVQ